MDNGQYNYKKPIGLKVGDKIATISLSWGGAGDEAFLPRYNIGKERIEKLFGLEVVETENSLKGSNFVYENPQKRAEDLMIAFKDESVKAVFSNIGGDDSIRIAKYLDFDVLSKHNKIFMGYSDSTITHFALLKAGVSSFYGPSVLAEFSENVNMHDYTVDSIRKTLFSNNPIGEIKPSSSWTSERIEWIDENKNIERKLTEDIGFESINGKGKVSGRLIGGCIEVMEFIKGTHLWPNEDLFDGAILFFETSEDMPEPIFLKYWLRNYAAMGVLDRVNGIIFGKPYDKKYYDEYKDIILSVIRDENNLDIPILYNMNFGHTAPMFIIPYLALATINGEKGTFSIDESGVIYT